MARPNSPNVPHDVWICGQCKNGNLLALTDDKCPVCDHTKDYCCTGPGEPYPKSTGLFPGYPDYQYPSTRAALPYYPAPMVSYQFELATGYAHEHGHRETGETPLHNYPDTPNDLWICNECGSQNCNWYDLCPICNRGTRSSTITISRHYYTGAIPPYYDGMSTAYSSSSSGYTSFGGAGSAADGSWYCGNCGGANSALNDYCADPDCGAARP
jgi:hypothetical protein